MKSFSIKDGKIAFNDKIVIDVAVSALTSSDRENVNCAACYLCANSKEYIFVNDSNPSNIIGKLEFKKDGEFTAICVEKLGVITLRYYDDNIFEFHYISDDKLCSYKQLLPLVSKNGEHKIESDGKYIYVSNIDDTLYNIIDVVNKKVYFLETNDKVKNFVFHEGIRYTLLTNGKLFAADCVYFPGSVIRKDIAHVKLSGSKLEIMTKDNEIVERNYTKDILNRCVKQEEHLRYYMEELYDEINKMNANIIVMNDLTCEISSRSEYIAKFTNNISVAVGIVNNTNDMFVVDKSSTLHNIGENSINLYKELYKKYQINERDLQLLDKISDGVSYKTKEKLHSVQTDMFHTVNKHVEIINEYYKIKAAISIFCKKYGNNK